MKMLSFKSGRWEMSKILDINSAMEMLGGDPDLFKILLSSFLNDKNFDIARLVELEKAEDTTEAAKYVHYFKGAARQIGAEELGEAGQELEDVLRKKKTGDLEKLNENFARAYNDLLPFIQSTLVDIGAKECSFTNPPKSDPQA